jgi:hypothetical protein
MQLYSSPQELSPEVQSKLEALDDVIFPAIEGDPEALNIAEQVWSCTVAAVGLPAVEETRHEYLRYARSTWQMLKNQATRQPLRVMALLKIIGMLIGDDI